MEYHFPFEWERSERCLVWGRKVRWGGEKGVRGWDALYLYEIGVEELLDGVGVGDADFVVADADQVAW